LVFEFRAAEYNSEFEERTTLLKKDLEEMALPHVQ
jgi:hypothetical protein